jgi:colicin import membrane protein
MLDLLRRNPLALLLALLMHVAIVLVMVFGLDWLNPPQPRIGQHQPVQARLVAEDPVAKRHAQQARQAAAKRKAEAAARAKAAREARLEAQREAKAKAAREAKAKAAREAKLKAQREAKAKAAREAKLKAQREAKAKAAREARLKAEQEAKAKAAREARLKAQREAKAKAAREAKARAAREAKLKAEREAKARAARERAQREAEMAAMLEGERLAGEKDKAIAAIIAKVQRNWLRPPGSTHLECAVRVRLGVNGSVLLAQVVKSSGNGAFDRSVEAAVRKADPLPMPESPSLIEQFRDITFRFHPDDN